MPRILLVDDDDLLRRMLRLTLEKMGHEIVEARNGKEAVSLFKQAPPDLVLLDLIMPEQEGLETIEQLKSLHPGVKIIAMSGGGFARATDYLKIAKLMGANHVLSKPFSSEQMARSIEAVLIQPKPSSPA